MPTIEQKHIDRQHLLEKIYHQLEGSLHAYTDIVTIGLTMGFERDYIEDLYIYLKVNGFIESFGYTNNVMLTPYGLRIAERSELAA